jgi:hypothetical protein
VSREIGLKKLDLATDRCVWYIRCIDVSCSSHTVYSFPCRWNAPRHLARCRVRRTGPHHCSQLVFKRKYTGTGARSLISIPLTETTRVALDSSELPTTGSITRYEVPAYATSRHSVIPLQPSSYNFTVYADHTLAIETTISSSSGRKTNVVWRQNFQFHNVQTYLNDAAQVAGQLL